MSESLYPMPVTLDPAWSGDTVAVQAGRPARVAGAPMNTPITLSSTYVHDAALEYGRDGNAGWGALETALGALDGGRAVSFASGLAATTAIADLMPAGGIVVLSSVTYFGVRNIFERIEARDRLHVRLAAADDTEAVLAAADGADMVWVESIANPLMVVADVPAMIDFTTANDAMEVFFRNLYRPYVQARFGTESHVDEEKTFMDRCRGQTLARLHAGDDWVAGLLLRQRGESLRLGRFGASSNPPSPGASEVLDTLVIRHGYAHGVRRIVMGDTRPCLSDGVLRYKARFGAAIRPTLFPQPTLCISVRGWSDAVTAALAEQPLIAFRRRKPHVWRVSGAGSDSRIYIEPLGVGTTDGR